ncbi:hypothetical protein M427DRAFT_336383 [Gonapodya prolifera JEL478]|uniref:Uncharacterized protein n=1 Tax=Gonapodya prolifera (strain JEL478) TaxID=1344416 RepID=A0A139ACZ1_GONPJ|nr:hypothetical protein M427DRAFT_336383 [Gonapodya prolifera JEL478]|eukprot:KXS14647.1 hypothetical protein M427DRAFT_336383 [Gonapodya prolifera JEL478]
MSISSPPSPPARLFYYFFSFPFTVAGASTAAPSACVSAIFSGAPICPPKKASRVIEWM